MMGCERSVRVVYTIHLLILFSDYLVTGTARRESDKVQTVWWNDEGHPQNTIAAPAVSSVYYSSRWSGREYHKYQENRKSRYPLVHLERANAGHLFMRFWKVLFVIRPQIYC